MKKAVFFVIFFVLALLFIILLVIDPFNKITAALDKGSVLIDNSGDAAGFFECRNPVDLGNRYIHVKSDRITYRALCLEVKGEKIVEFHTSLRKEVNVFFNVKKTDHFDVPINVQVQTHSREKQDIIEEHEISDKNHILTINARIFLDDGEHIRVLLKGDGHVLVTYPVFFRDVPDKKLIFLISVDTLRADHVGVYGSSRPVDPRITRFAGDCVVFKNCFAPSSWTLPSHVSLFSGLNAYNHGTYNRDNAIPDDIFLLQESLFPDHLNISYNGGVFLKYIYGFYRGFDSYRSKNHPKSSKVIFERMIRFLKRTPSPGLFAFLHTYQVHSPYRLHPLHSYSRQVLKTDQTKYVKIPDVVGGHQNIFRPVSDELKEKIINLYKCEYEFFDFWFGYFIQNLKKLKLYDRSMIILFSDHGEEFFDHRGWGHGQSLYNELVHVPLMIKFPAQLHRGATVEANVGLIDLIPTILDFHEIDHQKTIDGISLLPAIHSQGRGDRKIVSVLKYSDGVTPSAKLEKVAVIYRNFKLIYNYPYSQEALDFYAEFPPPEIKQYELYDIETDYGERDNLAYRQEYWKIFEELKKEIKQILNLIKDRPYKSKILRHSREELEKLKNFGYI
jgi:arylsulfatase A-like enzyme